MNRKVAGILLLFCLIAPFATTYAYLKYQKHLVRKEVKRQLFAGMDRDRLVLIKLTAKESRRLLDWEHSREFEFHGEMYDLVEKSVQADTIYYWCWPDHEETQLDKQLDRMVDRVLGTHPQKKESQDKLLSFYQSLFFKDFDTLLPDCLQEIINIPLYTEKYLSIRHAPVPPPPRSC
ncbi:MAG: hypothetical protein JW801_10620 [Bacteroidales bacterium]|nr:hypothetical protein [Bacteroidales bacterium]